MNAARQLDHDTLAGNKELSLNGVCSYHINGEFIGMDVEEVKNYRQSGSSNTLALEVWALPAPYQGGAFSGYKIAGVTLGELSGQCYYRNLNYSLPIQNPGPGSWILVLMLREWDNGAYITRDYINFPQPVKAQYRISLSLDGLPVYLR